MATSPEQPGQPSGSQNVPEQPLGSTPAEHRDAIPRPQEPFPHEHPATFWEREDRRWGLRNQARDFIIVAVMIVLYLIWAAIVYFFEPGIR